MERYQIVYRTPDGVRAYCLEDMTLETARRMLAQFRELYMNEDGTPRTYANGRGFYLVSNPTIVRVR